MNYGHDSARACVRCGKELTDAASMEVGIGPICRGRDNALLAQSFAANVPAAREAIDRIPAEKLDPTSFATFQNVVAALASPMPRADWRLPVKQIEWILSFPLNRKALLQPFVAVVEALGYIGLSALWQGQASVGEATVRYENGHLYLKGVRNPHWRTALRDMKGTRFDSTLREWVVPAHHHEKFAAAVRRFYPVNVGLDEAIHAAKKAPVDAPVTAAKKVRMEQVGGEVKVFTPYNAGFVAAIKTLPYGTRRWDAANRCWIVRADMVQTADSIVRTFYGEGLLPKVEAPPPAPVAEAPVAIKVACDLPF